MSGDWHQFTENVNDASMCVCGVPDLGHDNVYPPRQHCADCSRPLPHTEPEQRRCPGPRRAADEGEQR